MNKQAEIPKKAISFLTFKCQKCRTGDVFEHSLFNPLKFSVTYENCPKCGHKFEEETGFFWASMYISYGFSAGLMLILGIISINYDFPLDYIYTIIIPIVLVLSPFSFRYSRMILLYFISKQDYDPNALKK